MNEVIHFGVSIHDSEFSLKKEQPVSYATAQERYSSARARKEWIIKTMAEEGGHQSDDGNVRVMASTAKNILTFSMEKPCPIVLTRLFHAMQAL